MTLKQTEFKEAIYREDKTYVYEKYEEMEMDRSDYLNLMQRQQTKLDELKHQKKLINAEIKKHKEFIEKHTKLWKEAVAIEDLRFCTKCGMDLDEQPEKRHKDESLCVNCASNRTVA